MIEATSCGGVVIYRGKILALYKSYKNRYEGWVLPKGTVEQGETHIQTALREVREEAGVKASVVKYIGKSHYNFTVPEDIVTKEVHWYLMTADNYHSRPQREEFFVDSGYYKFHEIYHLLRFSNEKQIPPHNTIQKKILNFIVGIKNNNNKSICKALCIPFTKKRYMLIRKITKSV